MYEQNVQRRKEKKSNRMRILHTNSFEYWIPSVNEWSFITTNCLNHECSLFLCYFVMGFGWLKLPCHIQPFKTTWVLLLFVYPKWTSSQGILLHKLQKWTVTIICPQIKGDCIVLVIQRSFWDSIGMSVSKFKIASIQLWCALSFLFASILWCVWFGKFNDILI